MAGQWTSEFTFIGGAVRSSTMTYLAMVDDQSAALRILSHFTLWDAAEWYDSEPRPWNLAGIAVSKQPLQQMIAVERMGRRAVRR